MDILLAGLGIGLVGQLIAIASGGLGAWLKFMLFYIILAAISGWILTVIARRQKDVLVWADPDTVTATVQESFSGVGWKQVDGPGQLNFQARGLGFGSFNADRPVISVGLEGQPDGTTDVSIWTSKGQMQFGFMALCDRVVSKRFWLARKLAELSSTESITAAHGQRPVASARGSIAPVQPPAPADKTVLLDPGLPEDHPRQLAHSILTAAGLSFLVYGPEDAASCFRAFSAVAPVLLQSQPLGGNEVVGCFADQPGITWMCFESEFGAAIALTPTAQDNIDFCTEHIAVRLRELPTPWQWGIGTVGGTVPADFAHIADTAKLVELHRLPGLKHLTLDVPPELETDLLDAGWHKTGDNAFKIDIEVGTGKTLAAIFGPYNLDSFALMTPIDRNEYIPTQIRTRSYGSYSFEVIADMAVLCQRFSAWPPPTARMLTAAADALAPYTHQQFATPALLLPPTKPAPAHPSSDNTNPDHAASPASSTTTRRPPHAPPTESTAPPRPPGRSTQSGRNGSAVPIAGTRNEGSGSPATPFSRPAMDREARDATRHLYVGAQSLLGSANPRRVVLIAGAVAAVIVVVSVLAALPDDKPSTVNSRGQGGATTAASSAAASITPPFRGPAVTPTNKPAPRSASDADAHGFFVFDGGARCFNSDRAEMFMRTENSALVVCRSEINRLYYRGYRISDGARLDLYDVRPQSGGFVAVNATDDAQYVMSSSGFQLVQNGVVVSSEPAVEIGP